MNNQLKRKRNNISLNDKLSVIQASKNKRVFELVKEFGLSEGTIRGIIKDKEKLLAAAEEGNTGKKSKLRGAKHDELENALVMWLKQVRSENVSVDGPLIKVGIVICCIY